MRRKVVRKTKAGSAQDDKKLQGALKKLNVQPIQGVEEVNMFREDSNVLHFTAPKGTPLHPSCPYFRPSILATSSGNKLTLCIRFVWIALNYSSRCP